jgi:lipid-binding SYLF domain-containing protein
MSKRNRVFGVLVLFVSLTASLALAKSTDEERERANKAGTVLTEIMQAPDKGIPDELMMNAKAIAVIPHVVKGAFGIGGRYGKGLVSHRLSNGRWSPPAFIEIGGGSFGLQLGVNATDLVLVFTNEEGFKGLLKGKVKLGADASVAAGPVGRTAEAGTDVLLKSAVFAYSRSKGLFAGIALDGSVVSTDDDANKDVYGKEVSAEDILLNGRVTANDVVSPFMNALQRYSPSRPPRTTTQD